MVNLKVAKMSRLLARFAKELVFVAFVVGREGVLPPKMAIAAVVTIMENVIIVKEREWFKSVTPTLKQLIQSKAWCKH